MDPSSEYLIVGVNLTEKRKEEDPVWDSGKLKV